MEPTLKKKLITPITMSIEDIIGDRKSYGLLKAYYHIQFNISEKRGRDEAVEKSFSHYEQNQIKAIIERLNEFDIQCTGIKDKHLVLIAATMGQVQEMVESEYPLKCDNCNCGSDVCQGYADHEIMEMRSKAVSYEYI